MDKKLIKEIEQAVGEVKEIKLLPEQGCTSEVRKVITEKGTYLLKSATVLRYREWLQDEAQVLKKLKEEQFELVPKFYGFFEGELTSHLLMSYEDGETLTAALQKATSPSEKEVLIQSFGEFIQQLHETKLVHSFKREVDWLDEQLTIAEKYFYEGGTDGNINLLEKIKANRPDKMDKALIHGDCTTDNVLVVNNKASLFIDVAGMTIGDPRYDIALAIRKFYNDEVLLDAFYEGYKKYKISKEEFDYFNHGLYEFF